MTNFWSPDFWSPGFWSPGFWGDDSVVPVTPTRIESPINYTFGPQPRAKTRRRKEEELLLLMRGPV